MFDFTQAGGLLFWLGTILVTALLVMLGGEKWVKKVASYEPDKTTLVKHFGGYVTVTLLAIFALVMIYNTGGWVASSKDVQLNAPANPDARFIEAQKRDAQAQMPKTREDLMRERDATQQQKGDAHDAQQRQTNQKIGEDMEDFRKRVMERNKEDATGSGATQSGTGK